MVIHARDIGPSSPPVVVRRFGQADSRPLGPSWALAGGIVCLWSLLLSIGCAFSSPKGEHSLRVSTHSGAPLDATSPVERFVFEGLDVVVPPSAVILVEGSVGSTIHTRLRSGEMPKSLAVRRKSLAVWREDGAILAAVTEVLDPGSYSLVALGVGTLVEFQVERAPLEILTRVSSGPVRVGEWSSYCSLSTGPLAPRTGVRIPPTSDADDAIRLGLSDDWLQELCLRVEVRESFVHDGVFLPPLLSGGAVFEPTPWLVVPSSNDAASEPTPISSTSPSVELRDGECANWLGAPLCLEGASVTWSAGPAEFRNIVATVDDEGGQRVGRWRAQPGLPVVLGPVAPQVESQLRLARFSEGQRSELSVRLFGGSGQPRFVLTEVMADPAGPEPEGEWVEIVNVGTAPGELGGYAIADEGGQSLLPNVRLESGAYGLIVRKDFVVDPAFAPAERALPIVVDSLGQNGLRNSGERVDLVDPRGNIVSSIPAQGARSSRSWSRRSPWSSDAPSSFFESGEAGPTPGRTNHPSPEAGSAEAVNE